MEIEREPEFDMENMNEEELLEMEMHLENINQQLQELSNMGLFETKRCWICSSMEEENMVSPCLCRGFSKWAHQGCLNNLIDSEFRLVPDLEAGFCPHCLVEYIVRWEEVDLLVHILNRFDEKFQCVSPYITAGVILFTTYWTAVSYGTMTIIQIMGEEEGITLINCNYTCMMVLIFPSLTFSLILGRIINLDATLLSLVQKLTIWLPPLRIIMPSSQHESERISTSLIQFHSRINLMNTICASSFLPTISIVVGKILFFNRSYSSLKKTLLGGLVYICVKSSLRIYQRYCNATIMKSRIVENYPHHDD